MRFRPTLVVMAPKLPVQAVRLATVSFTLDRAGSFKMESLHLEDHRDLEVRTPLPKSRIGSSGRT
jgi:hypothetical protein